MVPTSTRARIQIDPPGSLSEISLCFLHHMIRLDVLYKGHQKVFFSVKNGRSGGRSMIEKKRFFNFSVQNFWQGWGTPCFMVSNYRANLNEQYKPLTDPLRPKMRAPDPLDWSSPPSVTGQRSPKQGRKVESDHLFYPSLSARVQE